MVKVLLIPSGYSPESEGECPESSALSYNALACALLAVMLAYAALLLWRGQLQQCWAPEEIELGAKGAGRAARVRARVCSRPSSHGRGIGRRYDD